MASVRKVAELFRAGGYSVATGVPKVGDESNYWVVGSKNGATVLNCQTFSVLGRGCLGHPDYVVVRDGLVADALDILARAGIEARRSPTPDQLLLSGYEP